MDEDDFGCDMRGLLSFQVMWLLSREPMHGEGIAKEIAKRRGNKPKAGTLYPALKELKEKKLIHGEKKGKMIVYSLTSEGKKDVKRASMYFYRSFGDIFESVEYHFEHTEQRSD